MRISRRQVIIADPPPEAHPFDGVGGFFDPPPDDPYSSSSTAALDEELDPVKGSGRQLVMGILITVVVVCIMAVLAYAVGH